MILVDSSVPMYLVGAAHPLKERSQRLLESAIGRGERLVTDAEVFQEILHRYAAIQRLDAIQPAFDALLRVVDDVLPIGLAEVERAKTLLLGAMGLSARDAVHVAVMERHQVDRILSFDAGYDRVPGLVRVHES